MKIKRNHDLFVVCNAGVSPAKPEPKLKLAGVDAGATKGLSRIVVKQ